MRLGTINETIAFVETVSSHPNQTFVDAAVPVEAVHNKQIKQATKA